MPGPPLAVVTGANRGLGLEVCRQLAARGYRVVLTARDAARGRDAARAIGVDFLPLDVADMDSVRGFARGLRDGYPDGVAVLVANAGVAMNGFDAEVARVTLETNFTGVLLAFEAVLPQLVRGANVVFVSSGIGERGLLTAPLRAAVSADDLTRAELVRLMRRFVDDVREGRHSEAGWPSSAYGVSKIGVTALARVLARELAGDDRRIKVNAVCPGWVQTDMGGDDATRTVAEGAAGIVWAATLAADGPTGGFFRDGSPARW
jgi:NAD(P)-dependent dehydrogenase (short-subunit alcohol dehydrogenase family)